MLVIKKYVLYFFCLFFLQKTAYLGLVFTLALISLMAFQDDSQYAFITFICLCALFSAYYYFFSSQQVFCPEEQKVMLNAYIINSNTRKKPRRRKSKKDEGTLKKLCSRSLIYLRLKEAGAVTPSDGDSENRSKNRSEDGSYHSYNSSNASSVNSDNDIHVIQGKQTFETSQV